MFENILVAYDGSDHSHKAVQIAGDLAKETPGLAKLWLVSVMDPAPAELGEPFLSQIIERYTRDGQRLLDEAAAIVGEGPEIHRELLFGTPAECILEVAETRGCDLIVIGTRGLGLLRGLLLGSQAQKVINHAACPVLVVK